MANKRKRGVSTEMPPTPTIPPQSESSTIKDANVGDAQVNRRGNGASEYEQSREQRIKENLERMQKLGIVDLSLKFKSFNIPKRTPKEPSLNKTPSKSSPFPSTGPLRRSSRLQNATPVSYSEVEVKKGRSLVDEGDVLIEKGARPEFYTEEHDKLLGSCEMSWTLFEDGCGPDGKRIYDSVKGKTCHQCRQKTLGHRTHCCKCQMVQGQFCGDCLYMRYGEHVLEANQNPNWICPVCRGICNCSLCRQAKGWPPTGPFYTKIKKLGFKSVAHYLIQTKRAPSDLEKSANTPQSTKRSLAFADIEVPGEKKDSPKSVDKGVAESKDEVHVPTDKDGKSNTSSEMSTAEFDDQNGLDSKNDEETPLAGESKPVIVAGSSKRCKNGIVQGTDQLIEKKIMAEEKAVSNDKLTETEVQEDANSLTSAEANQASIAQRLRVRRISKT
ncbi:hypothetical protein Ancab_026046 [Ancistrocladus abbreviatus]